MLMRMEKSAFEVEFCGDCMLTRPKNSFYVSTTLDTTLTLHDIAALRGKGGYARILNTCS